MKALFFAGMCAGMIIAAGIGLVMAAGNRARRISNHARIHGADLWDWEPEQ